MEHAGPTDTRRSVALLSSTTPRSQVLVRMEQRLVESHCCSDFAHLLREGTEKLCKWVGSCGSPLVLDVQQACGTIRCKELLDAWSDANMSIEGVLALKCLCLDMCERVSGGQGPLVDLPEAIGVRNGHAHLP